MPTLNLAMPAVTSTTIPTLGRFGLWVSRQRSYSSPPNNGCFENAMILVSFRTLHEPYVQEMHHQHRYNSLPGKKARGPFPTKYEVIEQAISIEIAHVHLFHLVWFVKTHLVTQFCNKWVLTNHDHTY
jgi:hypothetical protein